MICKVSYSIYCGKFRRDPTAVLATSLPEQPRRQQRYLFHKLAVEYTCIPNYELVSRGTKARDLNTID